MKRHVKIGEGGIWYGISLAASLAGLGLPLSCVWLRLWCGGLSAFAVLCLIGTLYVED